MLRSTITATARLTGALVIATALGAQAWADLTHGTFTWEQLPGYFTPLANLAGIVALVTAAFAGPRDPGWVQTLRVNAATYLVIVGAVYWLMLAPHASEPYFPWANAVIHGGAGLVLAADWLLIGGRRRPRWRDTWTVLLLPAAWIGYLLVRAGTDGWVPYPFLDPALGLVTVSATVGGIVLIGLLVGTILRALTALRPETRPRTAYR